jgi:hypothetical protein
MARFLTPKPVGNFRYGSDGLDGDLMKLSFADPVPEAMRIFGSDFYGLPRRIRRRRRRNVRVDETGLR